MVTNDSFRKMALSFPETLELPHFERLSFRTNKKIFATLSEKNSTANFKLTLFDQSAFCSINHHNIYPVPKKWGLQGWTTVNLTNINEELLSEITTAAYQATALKKLP